MASFDFETPELFKHIPTPAISPGAMKSKGPFVAKAEHQQALGFPGELVEGWEQKAIDEMGKAVDQSRALRVFLDSCGKGGACTAKCQ